MNEEELEKYCQALDLTVSPDNELRKEAEKFILESMSKPNFMVAMLQISSNVEWNNGRKIDVTQAAAIQLKNMAETHWRYEEGDEFTQQMIEQDSKVII